MKHGSKHKPRFQQNVLLRIYRNYSKDESVNLLKQEIEALQNEKAAIAFKSGELISENAELKDAVSKLEKAHAALEKKNEELAQLLMLMQKPDVINGEWQEIIAHTETIASLKQERKRSSQQINTLVTELNQYKEKYYTLLAQKH